MITKTLFKNGLSQGGVAFIVLNLAENDGSEVMKAYFSYARIYKDGSVIVATEQFYQQRD